MMCLNELVGAEMLMTAAVKIRKKINKMYKDGGNDKPRR